MGGGEQQVGDSSSRLQISRFVGSKSTRGFGRLHQQVGARPRAREPRGLLEGYQRAKMMGSTEEEGEEQEQGGSRSRRGSLNPELLAMRQTSLDGPGGSFPNLPAFSRNQPGRSTVCLADIKIR